MTSEKKFCTVVTKEQKVVYIEGFSSVSKFENGFAILAKECEDLKSKKLLKLSGKIVISKKLFGYVSDDGTVITKKLYSKARPFKGKYAVVGINGRENVIDCFGFELFSWNFEKVVPFINDTFIVSYVTSFEPKVCHWGLIDRVGNVILKPQYSSKLAVIAEYKKLI